MISARSSATPDLMALLCLMGGAVRGAGELQVLMQLLTIGAVVPSFGMALRVWISAEEMAGARERADPIWFPEEDAEGETEDDIGHRWSSQSGPILLWAHVTRLGTVMLIPLECTWMQRRERLPLLVVSSRTLWELVRASKNFFFRSVLLVG